MTEEEFRSGTLANGERLMQPAGDSALRETIAAGIEKAAARRRDATSRRVMMIVAGNVRAGIYEDGDQ